MLRVCVFDVNETLLDLKGWQPVLLPDQETSRSIAKTHTQRPNLADRVSFRTSSSLYAGLYCYTQGAQLLL